VQEQVNFKGCEGFLPKFPQTCPKIMTSKKTTAFHFMSGAFIQIKELQAPFLPKFHPNLLKKHDLQKNNIRTLTLGAIFINSNHIQ